MSAATQNFLSHVAIMSAIQSWMQAQILVPANPDAIPPTAQMKLFDSVQFYSSPNLLKALQELKTFVNKVCLIIPTGDNYETEMGGGKLNVHGEREFVFLISDKDVGARQKASTGDPDDPTHPGVLAMVEYLENNLIAQNFNFLPVLLRLRPIHGEPFVLQDATRTNLAGRLGWKMVWKAGAGDRVFGVR